MPVLTFKGKTAVENHHHTVPHHVLDVDADRSVLAKGEKPSLDGNLIIEGDNLLALKALLPTHAGRIKCIYVDPPYNTGNESWVYNDSQLSGNPDTAYKRKVAEYFTNAGKVVKWQQLASGFAERVFRFQVVDQGDYEGEAWREEIRKLLQEVRTS